MVKDDKYSDKEFDSKPEMHLYWAENHMDELNSHDKEKAKKAKKRKEEEKKQVMAKRKKLAAHGLIGIVAVLMAGYAATNVIPHMMAGPDAQLNETYLEDRPVIGDRDAEVTMVEFSDYRCPFCQEFEFTTKSQLESEGYFDRGELKFHLLHFPVVDPTVDSINAAQAAECAGDQGNQEFEEMHNILFETSQEIGYDDQSLIDLAEDNTGVDIEEFESCITSGDHSETINLDQSVGRDNAVDATPTVFINGERVPDPMNYDQVESMIESELE